MPVSSGWRVCVHPLWCVRVAVCVVCPVSCVHKGRKQKAADRHTTTPLKSKETMPSSRVAGWQTTGDHRPIDTVSYDPLGGGECLLGAKSLGSRGKPAQERGIDRVIGLGEWRWYSEKREHVPDRSKSFSWLRLLFSLSDTLAYSR